MSELLEERTVVALVNEETGLLTFQPVDVEFQAIFQGLVSNI